MMSHHITLIELEFEMDRLFRFTSAYYLPLDLKFTPQILDLPGDKMS